VPGIARSRSIELFRRLPLFAGQVMRFKPFNPAKFGIHLMERFDF
jgi:hypothetical protein